MHKPAKREVIVTKKFFNSYTVQEEFIDLVYTIQNGFETLEDAISRVEKFGYQKEQFLYVNLAGQFFPVGLASFSEQVIMFYDKIWLKTYGYRPGFQNNEPGAYGVKLSKTQFHKDMAPLDETCFGKNPWNDTIYQDLCMALGSENVSVKTFADNIPNYYLVNAIVLLGGRLFNTRVNVYCMECIDEYFTNPQDKPSTWDLPSYHMTYNVFNNQSDGAVLYPRGRYTVKAYIEDNKKLFAAMGKPKPGWGRPLSDKDLMQGIKCCR